MRLTLRTLLAYLDDTLEASEIKQIGQKVAESDAAQELIARIKQATRKRRLTTPTDGGPNEPFDANRVAAYLDNDLSSEEVAELEKLCLESDVHLAEMAASHQILTLVFGEPALIPPTARRRMYALTENRPARTPRPAPVPKTTEEATKMHGHDADPDDSLMALPLFRNLPWLRWALPLAAVALLAVLGVVLFSQLGGQGDNKVARDNGSNADPTKDSRKTSEVAGTTGPLRQSTEEVKKPSVEKKTTEKPNGGSGTAQTVPPIDKPSAERRAAGTFASREKVLVRQDKEGWKRVGVGDVVQTTEQLVSLPGYRSELNLERKVDLLLWGNLPEMQLEELPLLESSVTLHHVPSTGPLDADFTLNRGRVYLTNRKEKGAARVRLRFWREEVWDLTLEEPDTTIGLELRSFYYPELKPREGEEPGVIVTLYVLRGDLTLKVDRRTFGDLKGPVGRSMIGWDNKGKGLEMRLVTRGIPLWDIEQLPPKDPTKVTLSRDLGVAMKELAGALTNPEKKVGVALLEFMEEPSREKRMLGIRSLGAIDALPELLDGLAKDDIVKFDVRQEALFALKNWLSRGKEQGPKLFDTRSKTGMLLDKGYSQKESQIILDLLYGPSEDERNQRELYDVLISYLLNNKLIIRELAYGHLRFLTFGKVPIPYNPGAPPEQREESYKEWKKLLDMGKLPPQPPK